MGNRIFVGLVMMLWVGTMSWLMVARILPPFFHGEPPAQSQQIRNEPVCWEISYGDNPVGLAVSQAVPGALGTTEIHSRVKMKGISIRQLAPQWMGALVRGLGDVSLDTRTALVLDSLNQLSSFDTKVWLNDLPLLMKVEGRVEGPELVFKIQSGEVTHVAKYPVPSGALMASELMPESKLLHMYVGRAWKQEVYSPFRPLGDAMEIVQAEVVEETVLQHHGKSTRARKIEYRALPGAGVAANNTLRAAVWVADDGTVLRQDVYWTDTKLRFERSTEPKMIKLAEEMLELDQVATLATPQPAP